jgi:plasmid stabilization system protein ParE
MVQKIELSARAIINLEEAVKYLKQNFSEAEVWKFTDRIDEKLLLIKSNPRLGRKVHSKPNTYKTVLHKKIILYYQYKPFKKEILLLAFWNTLQNPKKLKI